MECSEYKNCSWTIGVFLTTAEVLMASVKFYNPKAFTSAAKRVREKRQRDFEKTLKMAVEYIFSHTPVWSGNTLSNYRFSSIRASHEYTPHGVKKNFGEINRAEAEKKAWSNFNRAKKDPDRPFFISNNTVYKEWRTGSFLALLKLLQAFFSASALLISPKFFLTP
jgi:hypothetical protein